MTTRHEDQLRDIEDRLRKPGKKEKVSSAEIAHLEAQRRLEKQRAELTKKYPGPIKCVWAEPPTKWEQATAMIDINGHTNAVTINPYEEIGDGKLRLKPRLVRYGYEQAVQDWAMWKWHGLRGSEVDDLGNYIVDCDLPTFEWAKEPVAHAE